MAHAIGHGWPQLGLTVKNGKRGILRPGGVVCVFFVCRVRVGVQCLHFEC